MLQRTPRQARQPVEATLKARERRTAPSEEAASSSPAMVRMIIRTDATHLHHSSAPAAKPQWKCWT